MTLLEQVPDLDCRKYKKDYGDPAKNQRDWRDWLDQHQLEYKYQNIIIKDYLHHYHPIGAYDLYQVLRRDHFLGWREINLIMKHLTNNNKFVEVDNLGQTDERKFLLFRYPRFPVNVRGPYSLLPFHYYKELEKLKA